jgi:hypothetical protein
MEEMIRALNNALEPDLALEVQQALDALEYSDIDYQDALNKCKEYAIQCQQGAKRVHAINVFCFPKSNEDEIAEAKTVLEDYAAETAKVAESCKNDADKNLAEIRSTYDEYRLRTANDKAKSSKAMAEEAAMFAAIGSLDKVEAYKLKVRVNEIAAGYHEKFTHIVQQCKAYQEAFTKAMATAERLLNA